MSLYLPAMVIATFPQSICVCLFLNIVWFHFHFTGCNWEENWLIWLLPTDKNTIPSFPRWRIRMFGLLGRWIYRQHSTEFCLLEYVNLARIKYICLPNCCRHFKHNFIFIQCLLEQIRKFINQLYITSTVQSLEQKAMVTNLGKIYLRIRNRNTITLACSSIVIWRFNFDQWTLKGSSPGISKFNICYYTDSCETPVISQLNLFIIQ